MVRGHPGGAERDVVHEVDVVADDCGLADDYAGRVVDCDTPAETRAWREQEVRS